MSQEQVLARVALIWSIISLFVLIFMLPHESANGRILGRFSTPYAFMLLFVIGTGAGWVIVYGLFQWQWIRLKEPEKPLDKRIVWGISLGSAVIIAIFWFKFGPDKMAEFIIFRVFVVCLVATLTCLFLYLTGAASQPLPGVFNVKDRGTN